jgi:hypothetical protein
MTDFSKMTKEQRIEYLKNMPDSEIDYSDIPPITDFTDFQAVKREVIDGKQQTVKIIIPKP